MEFKYTICYPDTEEIDVFEREINGVEAVRLLSSYDWKSQLRKDVEFYSPGIDFRRMSDKKRIIFSAIGNRKLEGFQVMLLIPKDSNFTNVFDEKNYYGSIEYNDFVKEKEAIELMQLFARQDDDEIIERLGGRIEAVKSTKPVIKSGSKLKTRPVVESGIKTPLYQILVTILFRILGIMLVCLLLFFAVMSLGDKNVVWWLPFLFFGLAILFSIATIKFKIDFDEF